MVLEIVRITCEGLDGQNSLENAIACLYPSNWTASDHFQKDLILWIEIITILCLPIQQRKDRFLSVRGDSYSGIFYFPVCNCSIRESDLSQQNEFHRPFVLSDTQSNVFLMLFLTHTHSLESCSFNLISRILGQLLRTLALFAIFATVWAISINYSDQLVVSFLFTAVWTVGYPLPTVQ